MTKITYGLIGFLTIFSNLLCAGDYVMMHKDYHFISGIEREALNEQYQNAVIKINEEGIIEGKVSFGKASEDSVRHSCFLNKETLFNYAYHSLRLDIKGTTMNDSNFRISKKELVDKDCNLSSKAKYYFSLK
jgi:hypothetical protein